MAQAMTSPPGTVRGLFGGEVSPNPARTSQQVSTWFDIGAGYDNNLDDGDLPPESTVSGYGQTMSGSFRYWRGRTTRSVEAVGRLFSTTSATESAVRGGEVTLSGNLLMGRRAGTSLSVRAANESAQLFGAFGPDFVSVDSPSVDAVPVSDVSPPRGAVENRWLSLGGTATAFHKWTPRQRTDVRFTALNRRPRAGAEGFDSDAQQLMVVHDWGPWSRGGLTATYRLDRVNQTFFEGVGEPLQTQTLEAGFRYERRFSSIRAVNVSFSGGATQIRTTTPFLGSVDGTFEPTGTFTAGYTLSRQWLVSGTVSRGVTALVGASLQAFANDVATVTLNGLITRRITLAVSGAWSRGVAAGVSEGSFDATSSTATLQYGFRYGGVFAGYSRYTHQLRRLLEVPGSIPPLIDRYSVRAGVTLWLPLYGAF